MLHLLFVDDTLLLCEDSQDQMFHFKLTAHMVWSSGLKINLEKCELILIGEVVNVEELVMELGRKAGRVLSTWVGLPLGAPFISIAMCRAMEKRFRKRLSMWKRQCSSKRGDLCQFKIHYPTCQSITFPFLYSLKKIKLKLEKIQRDFLWGGGVVEKTPIGELVRHLY